MFGFTFQDVVRESPEKNRVHLARILAEMVDKRNGRRVPYEKISLLLDLPSTSTYMQKQRLIPYGKVLNSDPGMKTFGNELL